MKNKNKTIKIKQSIKQNREKYRKSEDEFGKDNELDGNGPEPGVPEVVDLEKEHPLLA